MSAMIAEETLPSMQRGLSDWWTEETEYVFQRIERWAAFARGYNRLRSQRYSRGRLTMTEEPVEPGWNISANKLVVDDCSSWNPRFHNLQRSRRRKSRGEETRINCCGTFNYQSNNHLDNRCLETYRYDHSIYFKTIGEIRNDGRNRSKRNLQRSDNPRDLSPEISDHEEQIEWTAKNIGEIECHRCDDDDQLETDVYEFLNNEDKEFLNSEQIDVSQKTERSKSPKSSQICWAIDPIGIGVKIHQGIPYSGSESDGSNGNNTVIQINDYDEDADEEENLNNNNNNDNIRNNRYNEDENLERREDAEKFINENKITPKTNNTSKVADELSSLKKFHEDHSISKKFVGIRRSKLSPRKVSQPTIVGNNNIVWPGVLLNYKKNVDPVYSPHGHHSMKK